MRNVYGILWIPVHLFMYVICFVIFMFISIFTQFLGGRKSQFIGNWLLCLPERATLKVFNV